MKHGGADQLLLICTSNVVGGTESFVLTLAQGLRALDVRLQTVFSEADDGGVGCLLLAQQMGAPIETSAAIREVMQRRDVRHLLAMRAFIRAKGITSINIHFGGNYISVWDVMAIRLAGVKRCVATVHHAVPISGTQTKRMTALASRMCDLVTVTTPAMTEILVDAGVSRDKVVEIPPGIRPPATTPSRSAARAALGLPADALIVGSLGRIVPDKGFADLITAMSLLEPCTRPVHLVVGGDGPSRQAMEEMAMTMLGDRARFLGRIPDAALLYAASDLFVLPSHAEGFGMVFIEAAFHSVPSIGARVGGVPYAITHDETGLLVPPHAPSELALAMHLLLTDDVRRARLGAAARSRALSQFTEGAMATAYREQLLP